MNYVSRKMTGKIPYEPIKGSYRLRLDANESPFNISPEIKDEFIKQLTNADLNRYPDPSACELREAFAERYKINSDNVVAGNGSDELISVIMTSLLDKGDTLAVAYPDFSMYAFYADLSENQICVYDKNNNYTLDDLLDFVKQTNSRAVVFSNPCNPTSLGFSRSEVLEFVKNCPALCIIDEAYMDFWSESILDEADKHENLIVLKTLSKAYGAAGIRLGFAIGHSSLINALNIARSPYNVNTMSQLLGTIILKKAEDKSDFLASQAKKLEQSLRELLPDAIVYPTKANFVFLIHKKADAIYKDLLNREIAVRYFYPDKLRISSSTDDELDILLSTLTEIIGTDIQ